MPFYIFYLEFYDIPCNIELHGYGANDNGFDAATRSWFNINGVQELSRQWGINDRGLAVVTFNLTNCQIVVRQTQHIIICKTIGKIDFLIKFIISIEVP